MKGKLYETVIPAGTIGELEMALLVDQLTAITQAQVTVESRVVVTTDSKSIAEMLEKLLEQVPVSARKNGGRKTEGGGRKTKTPKMGPRFLRIDATGEVLSKQVFNKRLKAGAIEDLTNVFDAQGTLWVVSGGRLVKGPQ